MHLKSRCCGLVTHNDQHNYETLVQAQRTNKSLPGQDHRSEQRHTTNQNLSHIAPLWWPGKKGNQIRQTTYRTKPAGEKPSDQNRIGERLFRISEDMPNDVIPARGNPFPKNPKICRKTITTLGKAILGILVRNEGIAKL